MKFHILIILLCLIAAATATADSPRQRIPSFEQRRGIVYTFTEPVDFGFAAMTAGSVLFIDAVGLPDEDNPEFTWLLDVLNVDGTVQADLFRPIAADGAALGSTALHFSDAYFADGAIIYFGDDQDVTLTHTADTKLAINLGLDVGGNLEGATITEGSNAVYNATETPGGELGGTFASFTVDDGLSVDSWTFTTELTALNLIDVEDMKHEDHGEVNYTTGSAVVEDSLTVEDWTLTTPTINGLILNTERFTSSDTLDENNVICFCDTDTRAFAITLPAGVAGTYYRIINCGTSLNDLTITPDGEELLLSENENWILADGEALIIVYEGTEGWY